MVVIYKKYGAIIFLLLELSLFFLISTNTFADGNIAISVETSKGSVVSGAKVYGFTESGSYTGINTTTDSSGIALFDSSSFESGDYKFRVDYLGSQFWSDTIILPDTLTVSVEIPEGTTSVTVTASGDLALSVPIYLFSGDGSYLGLNKTTDINGQVSFDLPVGYNFKFRSDYLGYQYWSAETTITANTAISISIPHQDVTITVQGAYQGVQEPIPDIKVYLFTSSGTYMGQTLTTDSNGQVTFNLPQNNYKVRADYMGQQFWSGEFIWQNSTVNIPMADAEATVTGMEQPLENVNIYLFTGTGSYLGLNKVTDSNGNARFRAPAGTYKLRADYQGSSYWSNTETFLAELTNPIAISTGGGILTFSVTKNATLLTEVNCYLFTESGSYLGLNETTDSNGEVRFPLADGNYKVRVDYLGYQFWSDIYSVPGTLSGNLDIPHQDAVILVQQAYQGASVPVEGVNVYLFASSGSYMGLNKKSDSNGQVTFNLPEKSYKVRADYMGQQFWSGDSQWQNASVNIPMADAEITVAGMGQPLENVNVYLFTGTESYLGINKATDSNGNATFRAPAGTYKLRADYQGSQYWSNPGTLVADQVNPVAISAGGGVFSFLVNKSTASLEGVKCYVFSESGSYLGLNETTDSNGQVSFSLADGSYKVRVDYLGNQFWSDIYSVPETLSGSLNIPQQDVVITVQDIYQDAQNLLDGVNVYLFSSSGSYMGQNQTTDSNGQVTFNLPQNTYKVRADYMGQQFWSEEFTWQNATILIQQGSAHVLVTRLNSNLEGANVYLFTESGSYLGKNQITDTSGLADFLIPAGSYKFRVDEGGNQQWSDIFNIIANQITEVHVEMEDVLPPTVSISADPESITNGGSSILSWTSTNANSVSIDQGIGDVDLNGSITVSPSESTTYTITATGPGGTVPDSVTVNINQPPLIAISHPDDLNDKADKGFIIQWTDEDPDNDATISLFYDNNDSGMNGTLIVTGLSEDPDGYPGDTYNWNTSGIQDGSYYIYAVIDDGVNEPVVDYSDGMITIQHAPSFKEYKINASDAEVNDWFGESVSIKGDYAIVGAPNGDEGGYGGMSDTGSAYIYKKDSSSWIEQAKLIASDSGLYNEFGSSVSISDDYAIVGARYGDVGGYGGASDTGSAYIFKRDGVLWTEQAKLIASDPETDNEFGSSVSINGDYAIVGSPYGDEGGYGGSGDIGAAYIFKRDGVLWTEQAKLIASDPETDNEFGSSVSINGDYAIVGSPYYSEGGYGGKSYMGSAYIFKRDGVSWTEQAKLTASDGEAYDQFGVSVSINGDYAIVGTRYGDEGGYGGERDKGSVYIFKRDNTLWTEQTKLTASDGETYDEFGASVSIDGNYAMVGAPYNNEGGYGGVIDKGAVYIFKRDGVSWTGQTKLTAPDGDVNDNFGASVSISGGNSIVGAPFANDTGSAYIFENEHFSEGPLVNISANPSAIVAGGTSTLSWHVDGAGSVFIDQGIGNVDPSGSIEVTPAATTTYTITATGSNGANTDSVTVNIIPGDAPPIVKISADPIIIEKGRSTALKWRSSNATSCVISPDIGNVNVNGSIAVSPDVGGTTYTITATGPRGTAVDKVTVVVITPVSSDIEIGDNYGSSVSISGDYAIIGASEDDDNGQNTGAAHIFKREGDEWIERMKIFASDGSAGDGFGSSVSISGDYAIIGASGDDDSGPDIGSVYIFKREGDVWIEQVKLLPQDGTEFHYFGRVVSLSGAYAIVSHYYSPCIYKREGDVWIKQPVLASDGSDFKYYGSPVAISGDYAIVGSFAEDSIVGSLYPAGAAYILKREGDVWIEQKKIYPDRQYDSDWHFGKTVAISGDTIVVGVESMANGTYDSGAIYVFSRNGSQWGMGKRHASSDILKMQGFSDSVAIDDEYIVVGAPLDTPDVVNFRAGAAYIFKKDTFGWQEYEKLIENPRIENARFGTSVDIDVPYIIVGKPGSTYIYPLFILDINADSETIVGGNSASITWNSPDADSVTIDHGIGTVANSGSMSLSPSETTTYTITATRSGDTTTRSITIYVVDPNATPDVVLTAEPEAINEGETTTLRWTASNATSCTLEPGIGNVPVSGSIELSPTEITTYTVTATGPAGSTTASVLVILPPKADLMATPQYIRPGDSTTLKWNTTNADSCVIEPGIGAVDLNGSMSISPSETTAYTITVAGPGGSYTKDITVSVISLAVSINSPLDGDIIYRPDTSVTGTVTNIPGCETGVTVNGVTALVSDNKFTADHVPLEEGDNEITVSVVDADGFTLSETISVSVYLEENYISLKADEYSGVSPFETKLTIDGSFSFTENPDITYSGPGDVDISKVPGEYSYNINITDPGLYNITAEVPHEGNTYSDSIDILVIDWESLDGLLKAKWSGMRTALVDGDVDKALTYHNDRFRDKYESIYNSLGSNLSTLAQNMRDIELVFLEGNRAKYAINRDHNIDGQTVTITYFIYFSKDKDGLWKIDEY